MTELRSANDDRAVPVLQLGTDTVPLAPLVDCMKSGAVQLQVLSATGFGALGGYYMLKMSPWSRYAKVMSICCGVVGWYTSKLTNLHACMIKARLEPAGHLKKEDRMLQDADGLVEEETPVEDYTMDMFEPDEPKGRLLDELSDETGEKEETRPGTSYAQLRQHNRERAYKAEMQRMMLNSGKLEESPPSSSTANDFNRFASDRRTEPLNKYGDAFE